MPRLFAALLLTLLPLAALRAAPFTAFRDGESFTYKVGFAIFPRAGEITIAAEAVTDSAGQTAMRVTTTTTTKGFVRGVYPLDNAAEVLIDRASGRALSVREKGADSKRATDTETIFDYTQRIAHHVDRVRPERTTDLPIPAGDPLDLISALVQSRDWGLKPGDTRPLLVHFGRDLYELTLHAEGYEEVRTPLGKFKALVLVPRMEQNPKGLFKRGGEIKVWIAQDGSNLPVKMQLVLKYGTASLLLTEHRAGADTAAKP